MFPEWRALEPQVSVCDMGLTGPKMIKYCGDLHLCMQNTPGEIKNVIIKEVYYDPHLKYDLIKSI
jgi:hypothetical protein